MEGVCFFNEEPYYVTQRSLVSLLIESPFHWFQKILGRHIHASCMAGGIRRSLRAAKA